jgi:hypothetical protein
MIRMIEPDSEAFFERVIERAKRERVGVASAPQAERAPI